MNDNQLSCPLCNCDYGQQKLPRILTSCGHTFCQQCIENIMVPKGQDKFKLLCPQDGNVSELKTNNIKQFPKNLALLRVIQSNQNKSKSSFKDTSFDVSKINPQQEMQEDQQTKELITAIKQSAQQDSTDIINQKSIANSSKDEAVETGENQPDCGNNLEVEQEQDQQNLCLLHQKPLEVVCVVDLERICAKCAIFGQHKGHQFKSIEQIQTQNNQFYKQLISVYDQKQQILKRVQSQITKPDIISILTTNKETLQKQIREKYKKLIDTIKSQQKKTLGKLQKIVQKTQKQIDQMYQISPQTLENYQDWQKLSYQKLQIIQNGTFQQKLQLLLIDQSKPQKNIINKGKIIVEQIKNQQDTIITKAQQMLSNINMKSNQKIYQFVQSFVQVFDKPPVVQTQSVNMNKEKQNSKQSIHQQKQSKPTGYKYQSPQKGGLLIDSGNKRHYDEDLLDVDDISNKLSDIKCQLKSAEKIIKQQTNQIQSNNKKINQDNSIKHHHVQELAINSSKNLQKTPINQLKQQKQQKFIIPIKQKIQTKQKSHIANNKNVDISHHTSRDNSFISEKFQRPSKKKLKSIKVPQKYQKVLQNLYQDTNQTLDLTNAQLGNIFIIEYVQVMEQFYRYVNLYRVVKQKQQNLYVINQQMIVFQK